jgi:hypothetical protein
MFFAIVIQSPINIAKKGAWVDAESAGRVTRPLPYQQGLG